MRHGLRDNEAFEAAIREVGVRIGHSGVQMLAWLFRRHAESFMTEHQFEHVETALEETGVRERAVRGVDYDEGDYFGRTVNVAARIASKVTADRVLVGEDLARIVRPDGFDLFEVGAFELNGITRPVTLFEAVRR